jgi:hypothetical protein
MDKWGNYHSKLDVGDDVIVRYTYFSGRAPRESWTTVVITADGYVFRFHNIAETTETFCNEYGITEELKRQIINEVKRVAPRMRLAINEEKVSEQLKEFVEEIKKTYEFWRY